ncbi:MAG: hypothetical protein M1839_005185 [Geoglossum umbratile]|nr:MAG: hypothetical protein M1839_005185 [Geoglossum umbratile]
MKTTTTTTLFLTILGLCFHPTAASTSGSAIITVEDYPVFGPHAPNNPPFCGMPYDSLDLNRITAVQDLTRSECGTCIRVCGTVGCANVLAVDRGGIGLDLSTGISERVIGNKDGRGRATWKKVDKSACKGIWDGRMFGKKGRRAAGPLIEKAEEGSPVKRALVPIINPTPITTTPTSNPPPSSAQPTTTSLLTATFSANGTNATTVTVVTTVFTSATTTTSTTTTTTRVTTTPLDAVTYNYSNGVGRPQNLLGEIMRRMGWWTLLALLIVGLAHERGFPGRDGEWGDA